MIEFWERLGQSARAGLIAGLVGIVLMTAAGGWWLMRGDYQVLFADLKQQDLSAMVGELEKLKVPYRVDESSASILVDKSQVHATRIKLMGKELPLQGAVGFELFNNTDFGMTEFAQKINYQRALQGELTRTILSLSEIREARVHLALPEQGLFKQATSRPKAAITLSLREGQALRPEQVIGIQRLVAAATPGMTATDVTVVDRQGVTLSRMHEESSDPTVASAGAGRLELKKETEAQLARKASAVLDKAFGPGQALASVDVVLSMDQVRVTTEDVIPAPSRSSESRGVIVKERESVRDSGVPPLDAARSSAGSSSGSTQREVDYQVGRRVEQVTSQAGSVRRIQLVAVVRQPLDASQEDKVKRLLAAAVGAIPERGDTVVVQSLTALHSLPSGTASGSPQLDAQDTADAMGASTAPAEVPHPASRGGFDAVWGIKILLVAVLGTLALVWLLRGKGRSKSVASLNPADRQEALRRVQDWMKNADRAAATTESSANHNGARAL